MRHEKHTQSSRIPEAFALPGNTAAADLMHRRALIFYKLLFTAVQTITAYFKGFPRLFSNRYTAVTERFSCCCCIVSLVLWPGA